MHQRCWSFHTLNRFEPASTLFLRNLYRYNHILGFQFNRGRHSSYTRSKHFAKWPAKLKVTAEATMSNICRYAVNSTIRSNCSPVPLPFARLHRPYCADLLCLGHNLQNRFSWSRNSIDVAIPKLLKCSIHNHKFKIVDSRLQLRPQSQ